MIDMENLKEVLEKAEQGDKDSMSQVAWHLIRNHATPNYEAEAFEWLIKYENGNKIEAMKFLAHIYSSTFKIDIDKFHKTIEWYTKAAELGDAEAMNKIGKIYYDESIPSRKLNSKLGFEWHMKAAEHGNKYSMATVGTMYLNGEYVEKNYDEAVRWFQKAGSSYYLAICYVKGYGVPQNDLKAVEYLKDVIWFSGEDDSRALEELANIYYEDDSIPDNKAKAFKYYNKALEIDDTLYYSLLKIGEMYYNGEFVNQDKDEAFKYFMRAAKIASKNDWPIPLEAHEKVIICYINGEGVTENIDEAFEWWKSHMCDCNWDHYCETDDGERMNELAEFFYYDKDGDFQKTIEIYLKALELGNNDSINDIAYLYSLKGDCQKAAEWYQKAVDKDNIFAMLELGEMYLKGQGVPYNESKGIELLSKYFNDNESEIIQEVAITYYFNSTDREKVFEWLNRANDVESGAINFLIGKMYYDGDYVTEDRAKAFEYFLKSAELKNTNAMKMLAEYYIKAGNVDEAFKWFELRCDLDYCLDSETYYEFAKYYSVFDNADMAKVIDFYQRAANLGSEEALVILVNL